MIVVKWNLEEEKEESVCKPGLARQVKKIVEMGGSMSFPIVRSRGSDARTIFGFFSFAFQNASNRRSLYDTPI